MRSIGGNLRLLIGCLALLHVLIVPAYAAGQTAVGDSSGRVMEEFNKADSERAARDINDRKKQQIMFIMGITLLIFIITTVSLGVAMVVFAKPVFVAHMIFAGFSLTLAIAHAVVAVVWFFPR